MIMKQKELKVGVAGARWLGINCLSFLKRIDGIEITHACFPSKKDSVWWKDIVDEDEVRKMGLRFTHWKEWQNLKFDLVFSILHGRIFKTVHLKNSRLGIINLHPAPLPEYRGCNSYAHAIMNGDKTYRVTMHYVDEGIDDGPIISQNLIKIKKSDTGYSLYQKAQASAFELFVEYAPKIIEHAKKGKLYPAREQNEKRARYYMRDSLKDKEANLSWNRLKLYNFVRALDFSPFEPSYVIINGEKVYLTLNQR